MRVALVGNPNAGKTALFNRLTGLNQHVANWPGTTVEYTTGRVQYAGQALLLTDLPGIQGFSAYAEDERVTLRFLVHEPPDVVVLVADAARLERSLFLALETLEFCPRTVVALNKLDVAQAKGLAIDAVDLAARLGVPVLPIAAHRGEGLDALLATVVALGSGSLAVSPVTARYGPDLEQAATAITTRLDGAAGPPPRWTALRLLQGDDEILAEVRRAGAAWAPALAAGGHGGATGTAVAVDGALNGWVPRAAEFALEVADTRYTKVQQLVRAHVRRETPTRPDWTARLDALALHPLVGPLMLALAFAGVFWLVFQAGAFFAGALTALLAGGSAWLADRLAAAGMAGWLTSLVVDGVVAGVGAVLAFVPNMFLFFAAMAFVEATGYMARAALLADRVMQALGLHGKSLFPLVSAFGCNVPALTATRAVGNRRDRLITGLVIPFIPCSARLGVIAVLAGAFYQGGPAGLAMLGLVLISILVVAVTALGYRRAALPADPAPLLLDLPPYTLPRWRDVVTPALHHCRLFVGRIWRFLVPATVLVWALTFFPVGAAPDASYAARLGGFLEPLGRLLGFDWRLMVAIAFGFVAKETTLGTLGVLYQMTDPGPLGETLAAAFPPLVGFTFLVVYMLYVPCLATVVQLRKELGGWSWAALGIGVNVLVAILLATAIRQGGILLGLAG